MSRRRALRRAAVVALCAAFSAGGWSAESVTRGFDAQELARGRLDGVAVDSSGGLFLSPQVEPLTREPSQANASQVWCAVTDAAGNVFLGTGPDGRIVRVTPAGIETVYFTVDEPMVTALAFDAEGALLAGTSPEGRIYRIAAEGRGQVWSETGARYVWALARGRDAMVYAGTGEQGVVYRISGRGTAEAWFDADEAHIVALAVLSDGAVLAGGAGRGGVYRVDPDGNGEILHDDDLPEVADLAALPDGGVVAALLGPADGAGKAPSVRIRLPHTAAMGATTDPLAELEGDPGPGLVGVIEDLPQAGARTPGGLRGRIVIIAPDGRIREVWRSTSESAFSLTVGEDGRVLFGTGEPARVYGISDTDVVSRLVESDEGQATALARAGKRFVLATSNPGAAYRIDWERSEPGVYLSPVVDAGAPARWGTLRWAADRSSGVELFTRTGNSAEPDLTWSGWSPALTDAAGSQVDNPVGRYLQWRLRLAAARGTGARVTDVTVTYATLNRAPELRELSGGPKSAPWIALPGPTERDVEVRDPDGDPLRVRLEVRGTAADDWTTIGEADAPRAASDATVWRRVRVAIDPGTLADGEWGGRWVVSDGPGNPLGSAAEVAPPRNAQVRIDRTPPRILVDGGPGAERRVRVEDATSPIAALEVVVSGRIVSSESPLDGVCDGRVESFVLRLPADGQVTLRARDAAGNETEVAP